MMLTLHTETTIDSAHLLFGYRGKCAELHGHTWKIELWFQGLSELRDAVGILVDFGVVKELKEKLDHKYLNDVFGFNPTAENLTDWIYNWLKQRIKKNVLPEHQIKVRVRVYETAVDKQTYCEGGDEL